MIPLPLTDEVMLFRALIVERMGLHIDESRLGLLAEVLRNRAAAGNGSYAHYLERLAAGQHPADELQALARELTVTETFFLRSIDQFTAFTAIALPDRLAARAGGGVRILSAGCASGEEPYSIAIAVREHLPAAAPRVAIDAVDLNPAMLDKAMRARYTNWSLRDVPAHVQARWFKADGNTFELDAAIRGAVRFEMRNLAQADAEFWRPARFDIVFCRNVLMYFSADQTRAAVARFAHALAPGGYLFLGHAETLRGVSNDFHLCHTHGTFYYQRKEGEPEREPAVSWQLQHAEPWQPVALAADTSWIDVIQQASERIQALADTPKRHRGTAPAAAALRLAPDLAHAFDYLHRERYDQVLEQIEGLSDEHACDPDVLLLKAVSQSHSGALEAAEATCRELLQHEELNAGAHYVLALCREAAQDVRGALEQDQVAVYLDPAFAMPRLHMGLLARRQGDAAAAARELRQALSLLQQEDASRILLFGGGFKREALLALCRAQLDACGAAP